MIELPNNYGKDPVRLKSIAENSNLSESYPAQLIPILRNSELVRSIRDLMVVIASQKIQRKLQQQKLSGFSKAPSLSLMKLKMSSLHNEHYGVESRVQ